jgi:hypothetical protein
MSNITNFIGDHVRPFVISLAAHLLWRHSRTPQSAALISIMSSSATKEYLKAVARCRKFHKVYFLDLPKPIRLRIYTELFSHNTIQVCSFAKEHNGDFGENERCQILLTCKAISKEAVAHGK